MNDLDGLRTALGHLAGAVEPVDLRDRVLVTSRRLAVRRVAVSVTAALAAAAAMSAAVVGLGRVGPPRPVAPVAPRPTVLPSYAEPSAPASLDGVTVTVPSWGPGAGACLTGPVRITDGQYYRGPGGPPVNVLSYVVTDIDGDGARDYVAYLMCGEGPESPAWQVVAFRRTGDALLPMGRMVGSQDGLAMLDSLEARPGGRIAAQVADRYTDAGIRYVPHQWRVYAWAAGRFRQVDGPTSFPARAASATLSVTPSDLVMRRVGGAYAGVLTVTVGNLGTLDVPRAELLVLLPRGYRPAGDAWSGCAVGHNDRGTALHCPVGALVAGGSRRFRFDVQAAAPVPVPADPEGVVDLDHYVVADQLAPYVYEEPTAPTLEPFAVVVR